MRANFLVSAHPRARIPEARRLFVTDPYVTYVLEQSGEIRRYDEVVTASPARTNREAFLRDHEFVDGKYHRYVAILAQRLDEIHGTRHGQRFWQKAMALALLRHITFCYDLLQACETYLHPDEHDCRILSESSFFVPSDFNEHRRFFQHTDYGQEQLFGTYCRLFYPGKFAEWDDRHDWPVADEVPASPRLSFAHRLGRLTPARLLRRALRLREPQVAIINSYFSRDNLDRLLVESRGRIQHIPIPARARSSAPLDWVLRRAISREEGGFDRFDRFAFAALCHGMPREFVEDFASICSSYRQFLERRGTLRWIVCEAWIGDSASALLLALAGARGTRHLYNEHNYFAHPFLGNNLKYLFPLVDRFMSLGWKAPNIPNLVPGASLFRWAEQGDGQPGREILYVSSIAQARPPEVNASYGEAGPLNAASYFCFVREFFAGLSPATVGEVVFRAYPARHARNMQSYDMRLCLKEVLARVKRFDDFSPSGRQLMRSARLVIVDYVSTAYLEALVADIPMVFFLNREAYLLEDAYRDFFDELIAAGVCHIDPGTAARLVEQIKDGPETWWRSRAVRSARDRFLSRNFGSPETAIRQLRDLCHAA